MGMSDTDIWAIVLGGISLLYYIYYRLTMNGVFEEKMFTRSNKFWLMVGKTVAGIVITVVVLYAFWFFIGLAMLLIRWAAGWYKESGVDWVLLGSLIPGALFAFYKIGDYADRIVNDK